MSLIKCPECGKDGISDQATTCPYCGYPLDKKEKENRIKQKRKLAGMILLFSGVIVFIISLGYGLGTHTASLRLSAQKYFSSIPLTHDEVFKLFLYQHVPDWLLWISIILAILGIIFLIVSKKR